MTPVMVKAKLDSIGRLRLHLLERKITAARRQVIAKPAKRVLAKTKSFLIPFTSLGCCVFLSGETTVVTQSDWMASVLDPAEMFSRDQGYFVTSFYPLLHAPLFMFWQCVSGSPYFMSSAHHLRNRDAKIDVDRSAGITPTVQGIPSNHALSRMGPDTPIHSRLARAHQHPPLTDEPLAFSLLS